MSKILVSDFRSRHAQVIIKSLLLENHEVFAPAKGWLEAFLFGVKPLPGFTALNSTSLTLAKEFGIECFLPISLESWRDSSKLKSEFARLGIAALLPDEQTWVLLNDKAQATKLAELKVVPIPRTVRLNEGSALSQIKSDFTYKVVIKSTKEGGARLVKYAHNDEEAARILEQLKSIKPEIFEDGLIAQEYITGRGCAYFALLDKGEVILEFSHMRVREAPPTGGVSTVCESYFHSKLYEYGRAILKEVEYTGVAMVEFKYSESRDDFYFIEVNPKFWGSILLPVVCQANFPKAYVDFAMNRMRPANNHKEYMKNGRIQHVAADFVNALRHRMGLRGVVSDLLSAATTKDVFYVGLIRYVKSYLGRALR